MGPGPGVADDVAVMERGAAENEGVPNPRGSHPRILKRVFLGDKNPKRNRSCVLRPRSGKQSRNWCRGFRTRDLNWNLERSGARRAERGGPNPSNATVETS